MTSAPTDAHIREYAEAVRRLLAHGGYERTGNAAEAARWDIDHIVRWLEANGRPDARPTVHVAGSKGKGTTATVAESLLRAWVGEGGTPAGPTLLLTSPDLHQARERIALDGQPVDYATFAALAERLLDDPACATWSYFELLTVMGWLAGERAGCGWQVLEVGLGGRLDTTNAVREKVVAVVTPIDLEHTAILGDTIAAIAAEKAGVITGPCEVVAAPMRASALDVIRARAAEAGATLHEVAEECALRPLSANLEGQEFDLRTPLRTYRKLRLPLVGRHAAENAVAALRAVELAAASRGGELSESAVRQGLAEVRLHGRFEVVRQRPLTIVDGLHTPLAAKRFAEALRSVAVPRSRVIVLGLLEGKDVEGVVHELAAEGETVIVAPPASPRAADPARVLRAVMEAGAMGQRARDIPEAIERATSLAGERGAVIVAGSLYTAAEAREALLGVTGDRALGLR